MLNPDIIVKIGPTTQHLLQEQAELNNKQKFYLLSLIITSVHAPIELTNYTIALPTDKDTQHSEN